MAKEFKIVLHRAAEANAPYLSGSEVNGEVVVEIDEDEKYNSIKILLKGDGKAVIDRGQNGHVSESEKYVDFEKVLWDKCQSPGTDHVLPAGAHSFPFQFTLPSVIPSSFEVRGHGWIRYYLRAEILKSSRTYTVETPLQVTEVVDVNTLELDKPLRFEEQKLTVGCFCCVSGPITTTVEVPRTGYCAGEKVTFRVTAENGSNRRVDVVSRWDRRNHFTVESRWGRQASRYDVNHGMLTSWPMEPHSTKSWEGSFTISKRTPVLINTKIIRSYFLLNVVVAIPHALNLSNTIPITIGNVPYRQA